MDTDTPGTRRLRESGIPHTVKRFPRPADLVESAARQGIDPAALAKTLLVRRGEGDYLFVLVPGDRTLDWAKLRRLLGVSRLSLPDAEEARAATGYERGTITPLGAATRYPVIADERLVDLDTIGIGAGAHGVAVHLSPGDLIDLLGAETADVSRETR